MSDLAAHLNVEWWIGGGFAATLAICLVVCASKTAANLLRALPTWAALTLIMTPFGLGLALGLTSDLARTDRLDKAVVKAVETKYDVQVDRHTDYYADEAEHELNAWVIDDEATNCLIQANHHWNAGQAVITQIYAVCDGRELPVAS